MKKLVNFVYFIIYDLKWSDIVLFKLEELELYPVEKDGLYSHKFSLGMKNKESINSGGFGYYYQLDANKGIKVLRGRYDKYEEALNSRSLKEAYAEVCLLQKAKSRFKYIPKCYGVRIFKRENMYRIGIVLQHLGDMLLGKMFEDWKDRENISNRIKKQLVSVGVIHRDLHYENIMFYNNMWWVIDFSPEYIDINERKDIRPTADIAF